MPVPRIIKALPSRLPKIRDGMSRSHLADIRQCICVIYGTPNPEAHHLLRSGERGMGMKSPDRWSIPLSQRAHRELHEAGDEEAYLASKGIDGRAVATALWANRGDLKGMQRVALRAWMGRRL